MRFYILHFLFLILSLSAAAQVTIPEKVADTLSVENESQSASFKNQVDIIDLGIYLLHSNKVRKDSVVRRKGKLYLSALPAVGYTLITGLAGTIAANVAFYTSDDKDANVSSILTEPAYTQYHQILMPVQANIWTPGNKYNIQTDWSYKKFPQDTYGLGGEHTSSNDLDKKGYQIDYSHARFYQTIFKTIRPDMFLGFGYYMDRYWNVAQKMDTTVALNSFKTTDFYKYGFNSSSTSSGLTINFLYDLRRNSINPVKGYYFNIVYRNNLTFLGSDSHWQTILFDLRKYIHFPGNSKNVLGFWTYNLINLQGNPPYLAMPFTGCDTFINSGRGYIQGRFRGKSMLYFEVEYRFGILHNGLLGGVVFANAQSFTEPVTQNFENIHPACGGGLRFKLNKFSNTNVALDYGFGLNGSQGIFVNLGKCFEDFGFTKYDWRFRL